MFLCANCILRYRYRHTHIRTLAVLKVNGKHLTDLGEASISPLTFKMKLSNLVLAVRSSPDKFKSAGKERRTPYTSGVLARDLFPFSAERTRVLVWSAQANPKWKCPLLQLRWQGMLAQLTGAPSVIKFPCVWVTGNYNHCLQRLQNTMRFLSYKQTSIILERQTDPQTDTTGENKYPFVCTAGGNFPLDRKSLLWWMNIVYTLEEELLYIS